MPARSLIKGMKPIVANIEKHFLIMLGVALWVCLQTGLSRAETFVPGQIVSLECKPNPFDPTKITQARIYSDASAYSSLVHEGCKLRLRVSGVKGGWIQVQDQEGKVNGFVSQNSLVLIQDVPAAPADAAKSSMQHPKPDNSSPPGPEPVKGDGVAHQQSPQGRPSKPDTTGDLQSAPAAQGPASRALVEPAQSWPDAGRQAGEKARPSAQDSSGSLSAPATSWPSAPAPGNASKPHENQPATNLPPISGTPGQAAPPNLRETVTDTPADEAGAKAEKRKSAKVHGEAKKGKPPARCSSLYIKMSMGKVLSREEEEFLRRHCN